jgi:hypothetical protein
MVVDKEKKAKLEIIRDETLDDVILVLKTQDGVIRLFSKKEFEFFCRGEGLREKIKKVLSEHPKYRYRQVDSFVDLFSKIFLLFI